MLVPLTRVHHHWALSGHGAMRQLCSTPRVRGEKEIGLCFHAISPFDARTSRNLRVKLGHSCSAEMNAAPTRSPPAAENALATASTLEDDIAARCCIVLRYLALLAILAFGARAKISLGPRHSGARMGEGYRCIVDGLRLLTP